MELTSDYPIWSVLDGVPVAFPTLDRSLKCDVVVIGGGITGALVAYHLADAGVETVLIDRRDVATGSTCGSTGLLQYEVDIPLHELVKRIPRRNAIRSYQLCGEAVTKLGSLIGKLKIDCGFERHPSLYFTRKSSDVAKLKEEFLIRREAGFDLEFWTQSDVKRRYPFSCPAALFSELGAQVDPYKLAHGLLAAGHRRGLKIFDRCAVEKFQPTARGIRLRTENGFTVDARRAVMACGFESMKYVRGYAGSLKSTYALVSEPLEKITRWHRRSLIWELADPYLYLRTTDDNRIIVGGEDVDLVSASRRDALIPSKTAILVRKFNALFPDLKLEVAYSWAGTFATTKDGIAYIGTNPGLPHAYFALGYGGNGITYSLLAAEIIRDNFLGRRNRDAHIFKFGR